MTFFYLDMTDEFTIYSQNRMGFKIRWVFNEVYYSVEKRLLEDSYREVSKLSFYFFCIKFVCVEILSQPFPIFFCSF